LPTLKTLHIHIFITSCSRIELLGVSEMSPACWWTVCRERCWVPWLDRTTSPESTVYSLYSTSSDCR